MPDPETCLRALEHGDHRIQSRPPTMYRTATALTKMLLTNTSAASLSELASDIAGKCRHLLRFFERAPERPFSTPRRGNQVCAVQANAIEKLNRITA